MIAAALFAKLTADSGVTTLVGTRVYPQVAPENAIYPLITCQLVSAGPVAQLTGATAAFGLLVQVDIFARRKVEADALAAAVRSCLDGTGRETWGSEAILASRLDEQFDGDFDPEPNLHRVIQQYRIWR